MFHFTGKPFKPLLPTGVSPKTLKITRPIDRHATTFLAEGLLSLLNMLAGKEYVVNHKWVRRLLGNMGHKTLFPKKHLSQSGLAEYKQPSYIGLINGQY
ncbi:hypothetical protein [Zobellia galactanivorans]|uniref:hypothetical protein n=1 Tax=Zobellia galactanivorans (strain DSM 12802 / CCUG 47099 / CIP 106680 / NCIMB 13871 / Dsij) TaxID=63186 RepID=UPI001C064EE2|nr:hypothetical protein [Zobellia galactanivorans]MBU3026238.1 hypothetical protein [Zobellia galactanivorans]